MTFCAIEVSIYFKLKGIEDILNCEFSVAGCNLA